LAWQQIRSGHTGRLRTWWLEKKSRKRVHRYIEHNQHQALGFIDYQTAKHALNKFMVE